MINQIENFKLRKNRWIRRMMQASSDFTHRLRLRSHLLRNISTYSHWNFVNYTEIQNITDFLLPSIATYSHAHLLVSYWFSFNALNSCECRDDKIFCMLDILELFERASEFIRVSSYVEKYNSFEKEKP